MRLTESHRKIIALEPAPAGWFTIATIVGAAFLLFALFNVASV